MSKSKKKIDDASTVLHGVLLALTQPDFDPLEVDLEQNEKIGKISFLKTHDSHPCTDPLTCTVGLYFLYG